MVRFSDEVTRRFTGRPGPETIFLTDVASSGGPSKIVQVSIQLALPQLLTRKWNGRRPTLRSTIFV